MNQTKRKTLIKTDWFILSALILLSLIPFLGGIYRLVQLASGAEVTPANARFFASPVPVVLHIISVSIYSVLGAFQFAPSFRQQNPKWHKSMGKVIIVAGITAGLSGLWMTIFYPLPQELQGILLYGFRLVIGGTMVLAIMFAYLAILKRDIAKHRAWMTRAYAIGQGAGTQALIGIPIMLLFGELTGLPRDLFMILAWLINLTVAEWLIRKQSRQSRSQTALSVSKAQL